MVGFIEVITVFVFNDFFRIQNLERSLSKANRFSLHLNCFTLSHQTWFKTSEQKIRYFLRFIFAFVQITSNTFLYKFKWKGYVYI